MTRCRKRTGFTLVELLAVVAIISLLVAILLPSLYRARLLARQVVCESNLRSMNLSLVLYLEENNERFFPYREQQSDGVLWYWGFEQTGAGVVEGARPIDIRRARLAPYISPDGRTRICPSLRSDYPQFKPKFLLPGYGYALNRMMLADIPGAGVSWAEVVRPSETVTWADSVQINTWQLPASTENPLLEEWYYLENRLGAASAKFHFRHLETCSTAFADGSVRSLPPYSLDPRCDGLVGRPEPAVASSEVSYLLRLDK